MQTNQEPNNTMFRKLLRFYSISLIREIAQPIETSHLKSVMIAILNALPDLVPLAFGKSLYKKEILYQEFDGGSGLMTTFGDPIFVQLALPNEKEYLLYSIINHDTFNQLIASLQDDKNRIFLQCLNLHPFYETLAENEKKEFQDECEIKLQTQKTFVSERENHDLAVLNQNVGIAYLHNHYHIESWEFLYSRIPLLKANGVKIFYLEWSKSTLSPLFNYFNETGDVRNLQYHLELFVHYIPQQVPYVVKLCTLLHASGITILPIDSSSELEHGDQINEEEFDKKIHYRDNYMQLQIAKHQTSIQIGNKFAVLLGIRHANVANHLNIPTIGLIPGPETKRSLAPPEYLQTIIASMQRFQGIADINLIFATPTKPNNCCTPKLMRLGFFAAAGSVAAVAAAIALQSFSL